MAQSEQQPQATAPTPAFNPFVVALPEKLDFRRPDDWQPWITQWDRYRVISGLSKQDSAARLNTLLCAMGREAEDVLASLKLSDEQKLDYDCVKNAFEKHFIPRRNIIYERATFNRRKQESHETVESIVTDLFKLAERCQYGAFKNELIRDRLVVGLLDTALSEKLQLDSALTLETAVAAARNSEAVKQQHKEMRGTQGQHGAAVDELSSARRKKNWSKKTTPTARLKKGNEGVRQPCRWCGSASVHTKTTCPASGQLCRSCGKQGHYASVYLTSKHQERPVTSTAARRARRTAEVEEVYLGELKDTSAHDAWRITPSVNGISITFKVDTGADVTAIAPRDYNREVMGPLRKPERALLRPGHQKLSTAGHFQASMKWGGQQVQEDVLVVEGLQEAHLGRPAIRSLGVLPQLLNVTVFLKEWGVIQSTSSPHYPQSNGEAERTVQTVKQLLGKSTDIQKALLAQPATPGIEGDAPAELFMGRRLRTNVPVKPKSLQPRWDTTDFRSRNALYKEKMRQHYDERRRTRELDTLPPGTAVRILTRAASYGHILGPAPQPRSYVVQTTTGTTRRTRGHLQPAVATTVTRSGRISRPPDRFGEV
ncbi:uncharacterized protein ISCGN_026705 [Ixodes scapularis]